MEQADRYLLWAQGENPGVWVDHSRVAAQAAARISGRCGMDGERACCLALLHDIGRYKGPTAMMHILDGYRMLCENGHFEAAQICITHSFPTQNFGEYSGMDDCNEMDRDQIKQVLNRAVYSDYDRLIQLCDSIALPSGICLMEKRLVDVTMRHGINPLMLQKWKKLFDIQRLFESRMGCSLYSLFPEVVENTFGGIHP